MAVIAFMLVLLSGLLGFYVVTKHTVLSVVETSDHAFPTYFLHPKNGTLALFDSLNQENKALLWVLPQGECSFTDGVLTATIIRNASTPQHFHNCMMLTHTFTNFAYEIKMKFDTNNAHDCGGVTFHNITQNESQLYYFYICRDGSYGLVRYEGDNDIKDNIMLAESSSNLITPGPGQTYTLAVVVQMFDFDLYVNRHYITSVTDPYHSFKNGTIGVLVRSFDKGTTEVAFSDATVWTFK